MQNLQELMERVTLDELVSFVAVVEAGSFTAAADKIGRDPTIVSRRVGQLEERLGVRLLSRTTRKVALTEVGGHYYQRIRSVLDELESANLEASDLAARPQGLLRVALPVTFGRRWIAPLLQPFLQAYPNISIDARFADRYVDVVAEGVDVAIRVGALRDSTLVARKIAPFQNLLFASPAYLSRHAPPKAPEDLLQHACLGFVNLASWPDWILKSGTRTKTIRPAGPLNADNSEALLQAAIAGAGIIMTPDWLASDAVSTGDLVQVLPAWRGADDGGIYAVMPPGRLVPTKSRVFVDTITEAVRAQWGQLV